MQYLKKESNNLVLMRINFEVIRINVRQKLIFIDSLI